MRMHERRGGESTCYLRSRQCGCQAQQCGPTASSSSSSHRRSQCIHYTQHTTDRHLPVSGVQPARQLRGHHRRAVVQPDDAPCAAAGAQELHAYPELILLRSGGKETKVL